MKIPFVRRYHFAERIPIFYGLIYMDYRKKKSVVCYPIPFNVIIRLVLEIWRRLRCGLFRSKYEMELQKAKTISYGEGYNAGYKYWKDKSRRDK